MKMLQEVIAGLLEGEVKDIHLGNHWTAVTARVEGHLQCGLTSNPAESNTLSPETRKEVMEIALTQPAQELCKLALQQDPRLVSVGVAAINSLLPRSPESWVDCNAGQVIAHLGAGKRVALVGHFPFVPELYKQVGQLDVLELRPQPGDRCAGEAPEVIPQANVVAITSMTLINGTLEGLLELCSSEAFVLMIGPSTPLSPLLFGYGIDLLCGSVVENIQTVLQAIDEGKHFRQIQPLGVRLVTIAKGQFKDYF